MKDRELIFPLVFVFFFSLLLGWMTSPSIGDCHTCEECEENIWENSLCQREGYEITKEQCECAIACDELGHSGWLSPNKKDIFGNDAGGCSCNVEYKISENRWRISSDVILW